MDLVFGYLAGLLTLINPCVLPVLPIVLASSLQSHKLGPLALAAGMSTSFVTLGLFVASVGPALGVYDDTVASFTALLMAGFGLILLVPRLSAGFATTTTGMSASADASMNDVQSTTLTGQFLGGMLLGGVWSPCIGPTLGAAIGLASQGGSLIEAGATMVSFALGVSTLIIGIGYGAQKLIRRHQGLMQTIATRSRPVLGAIFVVIGVGLYFNVHHMIDAWAIQTLPAWLVDFSVAL